MHKLHTQTPTAEAADINEYIPTANVEVAKNEAEAVAPASTSTAAEVGQNPSADEKILAGDLERNPLADARIVMVPPADLNPDPQSQKRYGVGASEGLRASIEDNNILTPLIVDRRTMTLIDGHSRHSVAGELGIELVPVIFVNGANSEAPIARNTYRDKTSEMRVREFIELVAIEKEKAKLRKRLKKEEREKVPKLGPSKSRDRAAAKSGLSATSLETGSDVVKAIDDFKAKGDMARANRLRDTLNKDGIKPAHDLAVEIGAIKIEKKKEVVVAAKGKPEAKKAAARHQGVGGAKAAGVVVPAPIANIPEAELDDSVDVHIAAIRGAAKFVRRADDAELSEDARGALGDAYHELRGALEEAGIILEVVLD